jgi:hypothetical protein
MWCVFLIYRAVSEDNFSRLGKNTGRQRKIRFSKIPTEIPVNTDRNLSNEVLNWSIIYQNS